MSNLIYGVQCNAVPVGIVVARLEADVVTSVLYGVQSC